MIARRFLEGFEMVYRHHESCKYHSQGRAWVLAVDVILAGKRWVSTEETGCYIIEIGEIYILKTAPGRYLSRV
jgi:hypothetical protein